MPAVSTAPTDLARCPVHGDVTAAKHFTGKARTGAQRFSWRCLTCHAANNAANNHGQPRPFPTSLGFCRAETTINGVSVQCRRPSEHPADVHIDIEGRMWMARADREARQAR